MCGVCVSLCVFIYLLVFNRYMRALWSHFGQNKSVYTKSNWFEPSFEEKIN